MSQGTAVPSPARLLAVIELQNAIAGSSMGAEDVMRIAAERAGALTGAMGVVIALVEGEDLVCRTVHGTPKATLGARIALASHVAATTCIVERKAMRVDDVATDARADVETRARGVASIADVPLMYGEHAVGILEIVAAKPQAFTDEDVETLRLLATIISIALHRAHSFPRPRYDSTHDAQTGLENRRAFDERVAAELTRNKRYGQTFSLALLNLAGFTTAVDLFGQATGDQILRDIATVLKAHTRVIDTCFRLGGDEFAIVMPGTPLDGAKIVAERCRAHIVDAKLAESAITASFGVVEAEGEVLAELIERANAALLADKAASR
ncbi:MAG: sensor domain-containing diguanylate cyclase [Proteobacteria bacterium]|nr:sensor domain-containing diguanylate cyclase [Pseudomonadota bacterium]